MIRTLIVVTTYYFAKCMMMHDKTGGNRNSPVRLNMLKIVIIRSITYPEEFFRLNYLMSSST